MCQTVEMCRREMKEIFHQIVGFAIKFEKSRDPVIIGLK